jgi:hypothetical protein
MNPLYDPSVPGLSQAEFERQLAALPGSRTPKIQETRDLLPDFLRLTVNLGRPDRMNPLAVQAYRDQLSLEQLQQRSGLTSSDFGTALEDALKVLLISTFEASNGDIDRVCRTADVANYKSINLPTLGLSTPTEFFEDSEFPSLKTEIVEGGRAGKLRQFGGKISFSKAVWSSLSSELMEGMLSYSRSIFPALEKQVLAQTLEAATWTTGSGALGVAGLEVAAKNLRNALSPAGQKCGLPISALILPSALEMTARTLREAMGWRELGLVVLPDLTSDTTWFAVCDPRLSAPLLRLKLGLLGGVPRIYSNQRGLVLGAQFAVEHSFDIVASPNVPGLVEMSP